MSVRTCPVVRPTHSIKTATLAGTGRRPTGAVKPAYSPPRKLGRPTRIRHTFACVRRAVKVASHLLTMSPSAPDTTGLLERIELTMRSRGMSQTDLARETGMTRSTMSRLMSGQRKVSAGELAVLAHALDVTVAELIGETPPDLEAAPVAELGMAGAGGSVKSRPLALAARLGGESTDFDAALGRARELLELTDQFDKLVAAPPLDLAEFPSVPTNGRYVDQGMRLAARVRTVLALGDECVEDVSALAAERFGLAVAREPLPYDLLGLLVTDEPTGRDGAGQAGATLVLVNSEDTYGRQRFTIAHELGHLLFGDADTRFFDLRKSKDWRETRANYFAAAFLMPEGGVRMAAEKLGPRPTGEAQAHEWAEQLVCDVATTFHSSVQSAIYRCNALSFFDRAVSDRLVESSAFDMLRRTGHGEYQDVHGIGKNDVDPPKLLADKALYAYTQGLVGIGALARLWRAADETELRAELADAGWVQEF